MKPFVDNPCTPPSTIKAEYKARVRTGRVLRSLIQKKDLNSSYETDWHSNSIPSKVTRVDNSLIASGVHVNLAYLSSTIMPVREWERRPFDINKAIAKEKLYSSQVLSKEIVPKSKLDRSLRCTSITSMPEKLPRFRNSLPTSQASPRADAKKAGPSRQIASISARRGSIIPLEAAFRDKEWLTKARDQIVKDTSERLARGNGVIVGELGTYKYFMGKGNNSKLVKSILQTRWWWTITDKRDEANLIWAQTRDIEWFRNAEQTSGEWSGNSQDEKITCKVRFVADKALKNCTSQVDIDSLNLEALFTPESFLAGVPQDWTGRRLRTHNKLERTYHLANKKALYINLKQYCEAAGLSLFDRVPLTFHIQSGPEDPVFQDFLAAFQTYNQDLGDKVSRNIWIVKPGENSNRGSGITVCNTTEQVRQEIKPTVCERTGRVHTYIVQRYLDRPYLINKRKFDLRLYALVTSINGCMQCYYYNEGYLRTSSKEFSLTSMSRMIHLTNDAVQKKGEEYGRYESGNKLSYTEFQRYLDLNYGSPVNFQSEVLPKIIDLIKDTMFATFTKLDPSHIVHSFEIYGYDFMLDAELKPWLIEVNTNPCLELSAGTLARVIPQMLENAFQIAIDPYFPEPKACRRRHASAYSKVIRKNKFLLIFNSKTDGQCFLDRAREAGTITALFETEQGLEELAKDDEEVHDDEVAPA